MSAAATYSFKRGETITLAIDIVSGNRADVDSVAAKLRPLEPGSNELAADANLAATFEVTPRDVSGDVPAGWTLVIDAATSTSLPAGRYLADARLALGGSVETTESVIVAIEEPATVTAGSGTP